MTDRIWWCAMFGGEGNGEYPEMTFTSGRGGVDAW